MQIRKLSHSLNEHFLGILRDEQTPSHIFREIIGSTAILLFAEASKNLPLRKIKIRTPLERTTVSKIDCKIAFIPILRAGLAMVGVLHSMFPAASVYYIGIKRDEKTLEPIPYFSNIDKGIKNSYVFILDPMLATGGTLVYSVEQVAQLEPTQIYILSIVASPDGLMNLSDATKKINIPVSAFVSAIDRKLNKQGYILPGLGDAGDRAFGNK